MPIKKRMKAVKNSNEKNKKKFNNTDQALLGFSLLNKPWVYVIAAFFIVLAVSGGVWFSQNSQKKEVQMSVPQDCPVIADQGDDSDNDGFKFVCTTPSRCKSREHGKINISYTCQSNTIPSEYKQDGNNCCQIKVNCESRPNKTINNLNYEFKCLLVQMGDMGDNVKCQNYARANGLPFPEDAMSAVGKCGWDIDPFKSKICCAIVEL